MHVCGRRLLLLMRMLVTDMLLLWSGWWGHRLSSIRTSLWMWLLWHWGWQCLSMRRSVLLVHGLHVHGRSIRMAGQSRGRHLMILTHWRSISART